MDRELVLAVRDFMYGKKNNDEESHYGINNQDLYSQVSIKHV